MFGTFMRRSVVFTTFMLALAAPSYAQNLRIAGALSNFDCWNETETETEGFEIELEDIHKEDVVHTWNYSTFGAPTVEDAGTAAAPKVIVRYHSNTVALAKNQVTHFGVSLAAFRPAKAIYYRWLPKATVAVPNPLPVPAVLPPHGSTVTYSNGVPMVRDVITNNQPEGGAILWVLPFAHSLYGTVALEDLMSNNPVTQGGIPDGGGENGLLPERLDPGESWSNDDTTTDAGESSLVYTFEVYEDVVTLTNGVPTHAPGRILANIMDATITTTGPVVPTQLRLSNNAPYGGQSLTGTVYVNGVAPAGGVTVTLASNNVHVTLPASVLVPANASFVQFAISTTPVSTAVTAALTARSAQSTLPVTGLLTVEPPLLTTLYLAYSVNFSGISFDAAVFLGTPAPPGGTVVILASSDLSVASVPASVTVPAGQTTAHFTVFTGLVSANKTVTITATLGTVSQTQNLTVAPSPRTISGKVLLQAAGKPTHSVVFLLRPADGSSSITTTLTLGADGAFTLPGVPAKKYVLAIKASHWLQKAVPCDAANSSVSGVNVTLLNGDVDGSNVVNVDDLTLLLSAYNTAAGDGVYTPNADLNENGTVDVDDLTILLTNYNVSGSLKAGR